MSPREKHNVDDEGLTFKPTEKIRGGQERSNFPAWVWRYRIPAETELPRARSSQDVGLELSELASCNVR